MVNSNKLLLSIIVSLFLLTDQAQASRLALVGAATFSEPDNRRGQITYNYNSRMGIGGGVLWDIGSNPLYGFQVGVLSLKRRYDSGVDRYSEGLIQVPALFRMYLNWLSFGVGPYYAMYSGDINHEVFAGEQVVLSEKLPRAQLNRTNSDYGIIGSASARWALNAGVGLLFDLRYSIGMQDNDTLETNELKFNDVQLIGGLQIYF